MSQFVYIKHADVQTLGGPVSKKALAEIYSKDGWTEATVEEVRDHEYAVLFRQQRADTVTEEVVDAVLEAALTATDVDAVTKRADLDHLALDRGLDPTQYPDKASLAEAIKGTIEPSDAEAATTTENKE